MPVEPRQVHEGEPSGPKNQEPIVVLYWCPECGNYVGSSRLGDLENQWNTDLKGAKTHKRSRCPDCGNDRIKRYARFVPQEEVAEALKQAQRPHGPVAL